MINGKAYKEEWHGGQRAAADCTVTGNADGTYTATIYAYKGSEISFDRKYHNISWNKVTNETQVENGGRLLKVGYQQQDTAVTISNPMPPEIKRNMK